jgi:hypothetical protein
MYSSRTLEEEMNAIKISLDHAYSFTFAPPN